MRSKDELVELILNSPEEYNSYKSDTKGEIDLSECDFSNSTITNIDFSHCDLSGSSFADAHLADVNFSDCDLKSTDFTRATILECDFSESLLNGTDFSLARVDYCNFADADMAGVIFIETDLSNSDFTASQNLTACRFDDTTIWPDPEMLPEDFDTSYSKDLSSLEDDDEMKSSDDY